jgi:succinate-acetate transporter protein
MNRWTAPPTSFQRWIAEHRKGLLVTLIALLLLDLVVGVLDLTTGSGRSAVGAIGGAAGIVGALASCRAVSKVVATWDAEHGRPGS